MKTAKELYPECFEYGYFSAPCDYNPIISNIADVAIQVDDNDYQGDTRVLFWDHGEIGYLQFGWGSCSGCDALQACGSYKDIQDLMDDLVNQVQWFANPNNALEYFKERDWEGDYSWHADEQRQFIEKSISFIEGLVS